MTDRKVKIRIVIRGPRASDGDDSQRLASLRGAVAPRQRGPVRRLYGIAAAAIAAALLAGWWLSSGDPEEEVAELLSHAVSEPPPDSTTASLPLPATSESAAPETAPQTQGPLAPVTTTATVDSGAVEFAELSSEQRPDAKESLTAGTDSQTIPADPAETETDAANASAQTSVRRDPFVEYLRGRGDADESVEAKIKRDPPPTAPSPSAEPPRAASDPHVKRAQFTTGMRNREPVDELGRGFSIWPEDPERLYFFTELRDLAGTSVTHKWLHDGKLLATINFKVRGPRWRVYSSKLITGSMRGHWNVRVEDSDGKLLEAGKFRVAPDSKQ